MQLKLCGISSLTGDDEEIMRMKKCMKKLADYELPHEEKTHWPQQVHRKIQLAMFLVLCLALAVALAMFFICKS